MKKASMAQSIVSGFLCIIILGSCENAKKHNADSSLSPTEEASQVSINEISIDPKANEAKAFISPTAINYEENFSKLSKTPNFKVTSEDNFLKNEGLSRKTTVTKELQNAIKVAKASLAKAPRIINEKELCTRGVDWIFCCAGNNPPTRLNGYFYPVTYFGYSVIRGPYSARTCGNLAVVHAVLGRRADGLTWLEAAQAHNAECVAAFHNNADFTLNYAISNHAVDAFAELGIPYLDAAKSGARILEELGRNYHPDPVPPGEHQRDPGDNGSAGARR